MISVLGRNTSGVKVMNLEDGVKVASFTKVKNDDNQDADARVEEIQNDDAQVDVSENDEESPEDNL